MTHGFRIEPEICIESNYSGERIIMNSKNSHIYSHICDQILHSHATSGFQKLWTSFETFRIQQTITFQHTFAKWGEEKIIL